MALSVVAWRVNWSPNHGLWLAREMETERTRIWFLTFVSSGLERDRMDH